MSNATPTPPDPPSETETGSFGPRDLLRRPDYRRLWLGQSVSDFGDSLTNLALLMLVNRLTGSTAAMATMVIALAIPQVTFGLLAGVYVDRYDRKRIMLLSDLLRAVLVLGFATVHSADQLWLLYAVGVAQGTVGTFFNPARGALLPHLVPEKGLLAANSLSQTSRIVFGLLGTATAGVLIGTLGLFWPAFVLDALTFLVSYALVSRIQASAPVVAQAPASAGVIVGQLRDGLALIFRNRVLVGTLVAAAVTMLGLGALNILIIPLILNDLQVPATWFGLLELSQTTAMVLSGALVALVASRFKPTWMVAGGLVLVGVGVGLLSIVSNIWGLLAVLFLVGWVVTPVNAGVATLVQTSVPHEVRGRSGAALNTLVQVANLLSMALAGGLAELVGLRSVFVLGGALAVVAGVASAWVFRGAEQRLPWVGVAGVYWGLKDSPYGWYGR